MEDNYSVIKEENPDMSHNAIMEHIGLLWKAESDIKKGSIIYIADNLLFRSFWYNGKLLFGNAVFIVGK